MDEVVERRVQDQGILEYKAIENIDTLVWLLGYAAENGGACEIQRYVSHRVTPLLLCISCAACEEYAVQLHERSVGRAEASTMLPFQTPKFVCNKP